MQRLLADATKLTGVKYDISNLSDVYEAIHVIQNELGITGTTALEAEKTFQGSFKSMVSAAKDLVGNLSLGNDIQPYIKNLLDTTYTFVVGNLAPMLANIGGAIVGLIPSLATSIFETVKTLYSQNTATMFDNLLNSISQQLPKMLDMGVEMINNFVNGLLNQWPLALDSFNQMLLSALTFLVENLPLFIDAGKNVLMNFLNGLINNFPQILAQIGVFIVQAVQTIAMNLPQIIQSAFNLMTNFLTGLINGLPQIILAIPNMMKQMWDKFMETDWLQLGADIIGGIAKGITNAVKGLVNSAIDACKSLVDGVMGFFGIHSPSRLMANKVGKFIPAGMAMGITRNLTILDDAGKQMKFSVLDSIEDIQGNVNLNALNSSDFKANTMQNSQGSVFNQTINNYSPKALNPSETARKTRNSTRDLILQLKGA